MEYYDRKALRDVSQTSFYYDVCLELGICDPLRLYDYYIARKVFAASKDIPEDTDKRKRAYKLACDVLEAHYGIERGTASGRRRTNKKSIWLPLTCPTPAWMAIWLKLEPELVSDEDD